jgi:hypothetical protein
VVAVALVVKLWPVIVGTIGLMVAAVLGAAWLVAAPGDRDRRLGGAEIPLGVDRQ